MASGEIDRYPAALAEPARSTLTALRRTIAEFVASRRTVRIPLDTPVPAELIRTLIAPRRSRRLT